MEAKWLKMGIARYGTRVAAVGSSEDRLFRVPLLHFLTDRSGQRHDAAAAESPIATSLEAEDEARCGQ
jgi:hypothetical protein